MREKSPFENGCSNLETDQTDCIGKSKNVLSEFFGSRTVIEICCYEIDEYFETGLVILDVYLFKCDFFQSCSETWVFCKLTGSLLL